MHEPVLVRLNNEIQTRKMHSQPVVFGAVVQLRHIQSGFFLTFSKDRADFDQHAMKVQLDPQAAVRLGCR